MSDLLTPVTNKRTCILKGLEHYSCYACRLCIDFDFSTSDTRNIKQVIHQTRQMISLPLDDLQLSRKQALMPSFDQSKRHDNGCQGITQLMPQHR